MKKLTSNQWLQLLLFLAIVINCVIHFTSPAYRYYERNLSEIKKGVVDFERRVQLDFLPAVIQVATNRASSSPADIIPSKVTEDVKFSVPLLSSTDSNVVSRLFSLDYHYQVVGGSPSFRVDRHDYFEGDSFFGSLIRRITPTLIVTDDYQFVRPLLSKFSLSGSQHKDTSKSNTASNSNTASKSNTVSNSNSPAANSTIFVEQRPDVNTVERIFRQSW